MNVFSYILSYFTHPKTKQKQIQCELFFNKIIEIQCKHLNTKFEVFANRNVVICKSFNICTIYVIASVVQMYKQKQNFKTFSMERITATEQLYQTTDDLAIYGYTN